MMLSTSTTACARFLWLHPQDTPAGQGGTDVISVTSRAYATKADYDLAVSPVEVLILGASYHNVQSLAGHVAYVINGTVWSWERHGWHYYSKEEYLKENSYRSVTGYVLDFGARTNIQFKDAIEQAYDNKGYWNLPLVGQYRLQQNNCGEAFCRSMNALGGHGWEAGMTPRDHENYINNNLGPYIRAVNHYP